MAPGFYLYVTTYMGTSGGVQSHMVGPFSTQANAVAAQTAIKNAGGNLLHTDIGIFPSPKLLPSNPYGTTSGSFRS